MKIKPETLAKLTIGLFFSVLVLSVGINCYFLYPELFKSDQSAYTVHITTPTEQLFAPRTFDDLSTTNNSLALASKDLEIVDYQKALRIMTYYQDTLVKLVIFYRDRESKLVSWSRNNVRINQFRYGYWFENHAKKYDTTEMDNRKKLVAMYLAAMQPVNEQSKNPFIKQIFDTLSHAQVLGILQVDTLLPGELNSIGILALKSGEDLHQNSINFTDGVLGVYSRSLNTITLKETGQFSPVYTSLLGYHEGAHFVLATQGKSNSNEHYLIEQLESEIANTAMHGMWDKIIDEYSKNYILPYKGSVKILSGSSNTTSTKHLKHDLPYYQSDNMSVDSVTANGKNGHIIHWSYKRTLTCDSANNMQNFVHLSNNYYMLDPNTIYNWQDGDDGKIFWDRMKPLLGVGPEVRLSYSEMSQWNLLLKLMVGINFLKKQNVPENEIIAFFNKHYNE